MSNKVYEIVTEQVLAQLEAGVVPWHRPWSGTGCPKSMSTGRPYRGINPFLLVMAAEEKGYGSPWWGTYEQIQEQGGQVRKGEKSTLVVFWKRWTRKATAEERAEKGVDTVTIPMLRYFRVFNADQADNLPEKFHPTKGEGFDPIHEAEMICKTYLASDGAPALAHGGDRAYYRPSADAIQLPEREAFESGEAYYSTAFHEMGHSTGHKSRLARTTLMESHSFGDESYSKEELVAEMTAAMLSGVAGIENVNVPQSAAYLASWVKVLKGDAKLIVSAAGQAQRAADFILGETFEDKAE